MPQTPNNTVEGKPIVVRQDIELARPRVPPSTAKAVLCAGGVHLLTQQCAVQSSGVIECGYSTELRLCIRESRSSVV